MVEALLKNQMFYCSLACCNYSKLPIYYLNVICSIRRKVQQLFNNNVLSLALCAVRLIKPTCWDSLDCPHLKLEESSLTRHLHKKSLAALWTFLEYFRCSRVRPCDLKILLSYLKISLANGLIYPTNKTRFE